MTKTESIMLPLWTQAPHFVLQDVKTGRPVSLPDDNLYTATVIMFICNHCPFVKHLNTALSQLAQDYSEQAIRFLAISSNDIIQYPEDSPQHMMEAATTHHYSFPYLYDDTQEIAKAYHAVCTPDFFVFNQELLLAYRGQFDDSRPSNQVPVTGSSIRQALECLLDQTPLNFEQKPSIGCNIKWKHNHDGS